MSRIELIGIELRTLMLEALSTELYKQYGYQSSKSKLFSIVENLAIDKKLIPKSVDIVAVGWITSELCLYPDQNTNFTQAELSRLNEQFHYLLTQEVISPGGTGGISGELPIFHVTEYGLKCIENVDILPYDSDNYLQKIKSINNVSDWTIFYITEALKCYNSNCLEASVIMIGLANENIIEEQNKALITYLGKNINAEKTNMENELSHSSAWTATKKLNIYNKYFNKVKDSISNDIEFNKIKMQTDRISLLAFSNFTRITRNNLSHPSQVKLDKIEVLMLFISFIKYIEIQYNQINYFNMN